jgi:hypothetical protein
MLMDDATLDAVRSPLFTLLQLMHCLSAVKVPGVGSTNSKKLNGSNVMSMEEATAIARQIEEQNLHSLYWLMSRSVRFLKLLSLRKRAHARQDLPEVQWGLLHGLSMSQLVDNRDGQERVESLLYSFVCNTNTNVTPTADSESLVQPYFQRSALSTFHLVRGTPFWTSARLNDELLKLLYVWSAVA